MAFHILYQFCLWSVFSEQLFAEKVILKSAKCADLFEQSIEHPNHRTTSWSRNVNQTSCSICNSRDSAKSFLVSKSISTNGFDFLQVDIEMKTAECAVCKNQAIQVFIMNRSLSGNQRREAYQILDNLTLIKNFPNKETNRQKIEHFKYEAKGKKNLSIVLLSAGSCTTINKITISYFVCEKNTSTLLHLPRTVAPSNGTLRVNLSCPSNALSLGGEQPYGLCSSKGKWTKLSQCICKKGYTLNSAGVCTGLPTLSPTVTSKKKTSSSPSGIISSKDTSSVHFDVAIGLIVGISAFVLLFTIAIVCLVSHCKSKKAKDNSKLVKFIRASDEDLDYAFKE
ncbi:uncharacterized protein LOC124455593 [Xenia sp. Carnegie-2017]|uniref:uncharacterized protein LOC124455593 n=1 Tax=Xenia sp. Carnegie-2017 TaxID=2897299 RepID=UPI001F04B5EB|nr:uncharacterized protein LOC124455593 [Xenia sp. Carnegie-2017]